MEETLKVSDYLPNEDRLLQVAEEATELAQAALKVVRILEGSNPTPVSYELAKKNLIEETADVLLSLEQVPEVDWQKVQEVKKTKLARWLERLKEHRRKAEQHGFSFREQ